MIDISYEVLKDESILIEKINSLEKLAKDELMKNESILFQDLYFYGAIDKSLKLINSFLFALSERNITILATLTRLQMDCVLRTFASTLVEDHESFCRKILVENKRVDKEKDINGNFLTDIYLCKKLGNVLNLDLKTLYKQVCGFVHFSSESFKNIARVEDGNKIAMLISKENHSKDEEVYKRLSLELANHFYYFGRILIEFLFRSWLMQKDTEGIT